MLLDTTHTQSVPQNKYQLINGSIFDFVDFAVDLELFFEFLVIRS